MNVGCGMRVDVAPRANRVVAVAVQLRNHDGGKFVSIKLIKIGIVYLLVAAANELEGARADRVIEGLLPAVGKALTVSAEHSRAIIE